MWDYDGWPEYVPVAKRKEKARKTAEKLRKKGTVLQPVAIAGRKIAASFWGKGWCDHMESFHDYENRLPRGRAYVRYGSVVHLEVAKGKISALVAGSRVYKIEVTVALLPEARWEEIKTQCAGQISSLMDLLRGKLSDGVMRRVADRDNGLFPGPKEITMRCSCPDGAGMCKHLAAVFYGVGARLDAQPELLFLLRGVDHAELASRGGVDAVIDKGRGAKNELAGADLSELFGIELAETGMATPPAQARQRSAAAKARAAAKDKAAATKTVRPAAPPEPKAPPKPAAAKRERIAAKGGAKRPEKAPPSAKIDSGAKKSKTMRKTTGEKVHK